MKVQVYDGSGEEPSFKGDPRKHWITWVQSAEMGFKYVGAEGVLRDDPLGAFIFWDRNIAKECIETVVEKLHKQDAVLRQGPFDYECGILDA